MKNQLLTISILWGFLSLVIGQTKLYYPSLIAINSTEAKTSEDSVVRYNIVMGEHEVELVTLSKCIEKNDSLLILKSIRYPYSDFVEICGSPYEISKPEGELDISYDTLNTQTDLIVVDRLHSEKILFKYNYRNNQIEWINYVDLADCIWPKKLKRKCPSLQHD